MIQEWWINVYPDCWIPHRTKEFAIWCAGDIRLKLTLAIIEDILKCKM